MASSIIDEEHLKIIGDPKQAVKELAEFSETAKLLSRADICNQYRGQWVALYESSVRAHAETLEDILRQVDEQGLPRGQTLVHFIDDGTRTLILNASG